MQGINTWRNRIVFICAAVSVAVSFLTVKAQVPSYSTDIHISEFLPNPVGDDATLEFIELHNNSDVDVDLLGWGVDTGGSAHFVLTSSTVLPAHGFLSFFSAQKPISLTNTGDTIKLIAPDSQIHDQVSYVGSKEGYSYNRLIDGTYIQSSIPTPNAENAFDPTPTPIASVSPIPSPSPTVSIFPTITPTYSDGIHLNEFIPNPTGDDATGEFIELYNNSEELVDLSGWKLDDIVDGGSTAFIIPGGATIIGKGYVVFYNDQTKVSLNNDSDHVRLIRPDGVIVDDISYESSKEGYSYNHSDSGDFQQSSHPTPGEENVIEVPSSTPTPAPKATATPRPKTTPIIYDFSSRIVINEIYPAPTKGDKNIEFIEIKNLDNRSVSLNGWTLDDEDAGSRPYHFKTTDKIRPKKVMAFDKAATKIALNNSDDSARLIDPLGKVIATLVYEKTYSGQSLSRLDDGSYVWTEIVTPDQENIIRVHDSSSQKTSSIKKKKSVSKQPAVSGITTRDSFISPSQAVQWPNIASDVTVRTTYGKSSVLPIRNQKQGMFLFLGVLCAGSQLVSGISRKEKIWFG